MEYSFPHYLQSKRTVDDRALNKDVFQALRASLPSAPFRVIEIGAGIGTMITRLVEWGLLTNADYLALDEMDENIAHASEWISQWAGSAGMQVEKIAKDQIRLWDPGRDVRIAFERADVFDFIENNPPKSDLLIAQAVLDLFPLPESLPKLFSLTKGHAWLTINFDGVTAFEPAIDTALDATIERLYHETMDTRPTGGDSLTGRHLFSHLKSTGAQVLAAGSSDWVIHPVDGGYPADEKYFLHFILHFFEESLTGHKELDAKAFADWLSKRRAQIEGGELVYIAHQMDFLIKP
jgi:SAM-dependent methyltransferase